MNKKLALQILNRLIFIIFIITVFTGAAQSQHVIMPIGDSITEGVLGSSDGKGFLNDLESCLQSNGISFSYVGPVGTAPYKGHFYSGGEIREFYSGGYGTGEHDIKQYMNTYKPTMLLIHLGTNDLDFSGNMAPYGSGGSFSNTTSGFLAQFIEYTLKWKNGIFGSFLQYVIVSKIIPRNGFEDQVKEFNVEVDDIYIDSESGRIPSIPPGSIRLANHYHGFRKDWLADGTHPNDTGYSNMGQVYCKTITRIGPDTNPPNTPTLQTVATTDQSISLQWTATGDDAASGTATLYELRYYKYGALTTTNFDNATLVKALPAPAPSGTTETVQIDNLSGTINFALRVWDESGRASNLSNNIQAQFDYQRPKYCDNFDDGILGSDWNAPGYVISAGALDNTSTTGWGSLAVYTKAKKANRIEFNWASSASVDGANAGGAAMGLTAANASANGYVIIRRDYYLTLYNFSGGKLIEIEKKPSTLNKPGPGDKMEYIWEKGASGNIFKVRINDAEDVALTDPGFLYNYDAITYGGVMLYGGSYPNDIDNFCASFPPGPPEIMKIAQGEGESAPVTTRMTVPLEVQITDINGLAISDQWVDFSMLSGCGKLSTDSLGLNFNGNLWFEAEKGAISSPMRKGNDVDASGGQFVISSVYGQGKVEFKIYIMEARNYKFWGRFKAPVNNGMSNSIFVIIDGDTLKGKSKNYLDLTESNSWEWQTDKDNKFIKTLSVGFHTLVIATREPNVGVDKILLTTSSGYTPSGLGGENQKFDNITDSLGLARTYITYCETAGENQVKAVAGDLNTVFTVYATAGPGQFLEKQSGDGQSGTPGEPLKNPFIVKIFDAYRNLVPGHIVNFRVTKGNGTVAPTSSPTDSKGEASALLTLGTQGVENLVEASSSGLGGSPVTFQGGAQFFPSAMIPDTSANNQTAIAGTTLARQLSVRIVDANSLPVPGYEVTFKITTGAGSLNPPTVVTDNNGYARTSWTLGPGVGTQTVEVKAFIGNSHLTGSPYTYRATALVGTATKLVSVSGTGQAPVPIGMRTPNPFVVKVTDNNNNPITNHSVTFNVEQGGGHIDGQQQKIILTDANGQAQVYLTMGSAIGVINQVSVKSWQDGNPLNGSPLLFEVTSAPGQPSHIKYLSGNGQRQKVGTRLQQAFKVRVTDPFDNPKSGVITTFTVISGGGTLEGNTIRQVTTDANGYAEVVLTMGTIAGRNSQMVHAAAEYNGRTLDGSPVVFTATADPDDPYQLLKASPDSVRGSVLQQLPEPTKARVADKYGNGIFGHLVNFQVMAGDGKINGVNLRSVTTDSSGVASVLWTLGPNLGEYNNRLEASARAANNNPLNLSPQVFLASADHGPATRLVKATTANLSGIVGETLSQPFCVQVTDAYNNPVDGYPVKFEIKAGGGTIGGSQVVSRTTDNTGNACVYLTLGTVAGSNNNMLEVTAPSLQNSPVTFSASALVGPPRMLALLKGGDQVGTVNRPLAQNIKVKVSDLYSNAIYGNKVTFTIYAGDGSMRSAKKREMFTLEDGTSEVEWTLGPIPGVNNNALQILAEASGDTLDGSPLLVYASARSDEPYELVPVDSTVGYSGIVGNPLQAFFQVRVVDRWRNPIENHPISFRVIEGGGKFVGNSKDTVTVRTDYYGIAPVQLELGPLAGNQNNKVRASTTYQGNVLRGSPITFMATGQSSPATQLKALVSNRLSGVVGQPVTNIRMQTLDNLNNPVSGHPVIFKVKKGGGFVGDSTATQAVRATDPFGVAEIKWLLGTEAGAGLNELEVNATRDGINPLINAPQTIIADAAADLPDRKKTQVGGSGNPTANGIDKLTVTITLKDKFGNFVPDRIIQVESNDPLDNVTQPKNPSTNTGVVIAYISSIRSGKKLLKARDIQANKIVADSVTIYFAPGLPSRLEKISGDNQFGSYGSKLKDPLIVKVADSFNNGIPNQQVLFSVLEGGGSIIEPRIVVTDSAGRAKCFLRLGTTHGIINRVRAACTVLANQEAEFRATGYQATPGDILKISGDGQKGQAGEMLRDPICVKVVDVTQNALWGIPVTFAIAMGNGRIVESQPDTTDVDGMACSHWVLGDQAGLNTVSVKVQGLMKTVLFQAEGQAGSVARLKIISGDGLKGCVGKPMVEYMAVQATDLPGNAIPGVLVEFVITQGGGRLEPQGPQYSDGSGYVYARLTPGNSAGEYRVEARSPGIQPIELTVYAIGCEAYRMEPWAGNNQTGTYGRELVYPVKVRVYDIYNNPVGGTPIIFQPSQGSVKGNQPFYTDTLGLAQARWQLGNEIGYQRLDALNYELLGSPARFQAEAVLNHFPMFQIASGAIVASEGQPLSVSILATDDDGDQLFYTPLELPLGAYINQSDKTFNWFPSRGTAGNHKAKFRVEDNKGGFDIDSLLIEVIQQNNPPQIISWNPPQQNINFVPPGPMQFCINAIDSDGDLLHYEWRLDGRILPFTGNCCLLTSNDITISRMFVLEIFVSDGKAYTSFTWSWNVMAVEFRSFAAVAVEYKGVQIDWQTASETDNAGFDVYRSQKQDEGYTRISSSMIPTRTDGSYSFVDKTTRAGNTYYYRLTSIDVNGIRSESETVSVSIPLPSKYALEQNYPNPFNPETTIRFMIPEAGLVKLSIFNMLGQKVAEILAQELEPGYHSAVWNGCDLHGKPLSSGVYYYRLQSKKFDTVKKMLLMR